MAEVERLLTASMVRVEACDPEHPHALASLGAYFDELDERFAGGFDRERGTPDAPADLVPPAGLLLVATLSGDPVGCGVLRFHDLHGGVPDGPRSSGSGSRRPCAAWARAPAARHPRAARRAGWRAHGPA